MGLHDDIARLEAGHLTREEASNVLAYVLNHNVMPADRFHAAIAGLQQSGHLQHSTNGWIAARPAPRRRKAKATRKVTFTIDAELLARFDDIVDKTPLTRNAVIKMLISKYVRAES